MVPLVAVLMLAVVQVGLVVHTRVMLTHAVRSGVRVAAVGGDDTAVGHAVIGAGGLVPEFTEVEVTRGADTVTVEVRYREPMRVPVISGLVDAVDLEAVARMRREDR